MGELKMKRILELALNYPWRTVAVAMFVAVAGALALMRLPVDAVPDITNVQVMVNTRTGALAPEEIEKTVTRLIEAELTGLPNVDEVRSISKYGLSQVVVIFHDGYRSVFFPTANCGASGHVAGCASEWAFT
jgi:cobalt-zinc-cadmium resistance protein CzcA